MVLKAFHAAAASQGCTKSVSAFSSCLTVNLLYFSNLTFGTGGKGKDGKVVAGWGYYEAGVNLLCISLTSDNGFLRLSLVDPAQGPLGTVPPVSIHTLPTHGSETLKYLSAATLLCYIGSGSGRVQVGRVSGLGERVW